MSLIWSLLKGSLPAKIAEAFVAAALLLSIGFAAGQHFATKAAIDTVADQAARSQAAATSALIERQKADQRAVNEAAAKARAADDSVHASLAQAAHDADMAREKALAALIKERAINAGMRSEMAAQADPQMFDVNDPRCGWGPDVRLQLDAATGAVAGAPSAAAQAGAADGAAAARTAAADTSQLRPYPTQGLGLSCRELVEGYIALAHHDRLVRALATAWPQWWDKGQ